MATTRNPVSLLAFEIGSVTTRAILFDVVEGRYRFLGTGVAPTTAVAPYNDIGEGIRLALDHLQEITGRKLVGTDQRLIIPGKADGSGVDTCVATVSAGPPLKVVAIGLLEDISTDSAQNLATTTYAQVMDRISLNDQRNASARLDAILRAKPDLVIVAGGIENGASDSVLAVLETVGLACYLIPKERRPEVLYAGNSGLVNEVRALIGSSTSLHVAPNVRPALEIEQLTPAQPQLAQVYRHIRAKQIHGIQELDLWSGGKLMPTATAFGRTIRFISKEYAKTNKGVLGVDVGSSATTIASAFSGELVLNVNSRFGIGESLPGILSACSVRDILRWIPYGISDDEVRAYIYNKSLYPSILPVRPEELAVEQALACQAIHLSVKQASKNFPAGISRSSPRLLPWFEPVIAAGSVLTQAASQGQSVMMLLNGLQPTGVTTLALDRNNFAAALGAAAAVNPLLTVQSLDASNFINLCTVISTVGNVSYGTPILRVRVNYADGSESNLEVKSGALEVIRLPKGQAVNLYLQPLHRVDIGMGGAGRGGNVKVMGGALGIVIDARGRPLQLPEESTQRCELLKKWSAALGG